MIVTTEVGEGEAAYRVQHYFHPSSSPNLIQIDVEVIFIGDEPEPDEVYYRRAFEWGIPPDVYSERVTVGAVPGANTGFLTYSSDHGRADPDPSSPRTSIAASGFFNATPTGHFGGMMEIYLGSFESTNVKNFTSFYGATPTGSAALSAINAVGAQVFALGQSNAATGSPVTAVFAIDGSDLSQ